VNTAATPTTSDSIEAALSGAAMRLGVRSESPRLDAELLLAKVLKVTRAGLILRGAQSMRADDRTTFEGLIKRRLRGMPVAYLTESREFWSMNLRVSPAVLVPRPETETLVEEVLRLAATPVPRSMLDLGTGSGAIALAIASERPSWRITAVDVSNEALDVAKLNAHELKVTSVRWQLGSWFDSLQGERFDLIVGNPPYVAADDPALIDLACEPSLALTPGPTGLEALQRIIAQAPAHLHPGGWLLLEHGHDQAAAVRQMLKDQDFNSIQTCLDLSGRPRVTFGTLHKTVGNL